MITVCGNVFTVYPQYLGNKDMYIQMNKRTNTLSCSLTSCYPLAGGRNISIHHQLRIRNTSIHHQLSGGALPATNRII